MNANERALLEIEFCNKLHVAIDQLIRNDFPEEDVLNFIKSVKTFLQYKDIKEYVKSVLYDKAREISNIFLVIDKGFFFSYRKFISILLSLNDTEVQEMLETNFAKEAKLKNFFILIEEEIKQNKDISNCENLFLSLMTLHSYTAKTIDEFAIAIQKDRAYILKKLIENQSFSTVKKYIEELIISDFESIHTIVPIVIERCYHMSSHYMDLCKIIITHSSIYTEQLLSAPIMRVAFQNLILDHHHDNNVLIKNYALFLLNKNTKQFAKFEELFLEVASSTSMVEFATEIPFSNKRLILQRLVDLKNVDEESLVVFIKKFPEYKNLLPML